ncbi:MAG: aminotransferase class IV [Pyrinomonadaceae bacterium]|nr:aminotransferase class IV [Pyrinomonadaceae bacterium]
MKRSNAALYGAGIFTTIAIRSGEPLFWDKHWRRLTGDAARVGIDLAGYSKQTTCSVLDGSIHERGIVDGRARITFADERPSDVWPGRESEQNTSLHIIVGENRPPPSSFRLTVSPYPVNSRSPLAGVKSCNYLENILAINEAKERGFHEGVRVNERGHITSSCMSNVFWLNGETLYTPALSTGCLLGTTREYVLENVECDEVEVGLDELSDAQTVFLTSAALGICPVDELDGRKLNGLDGKLLALWPPTN